MQSYSLAHKVSYHIGMADQQGVGVPRLVRRRAVEVATEACLYPSPVLEELLAVRTGWLLFVHLNWNSLELVIG